MQDTIDVSNYQSVFGVYRNSRTFFTTSVYLGQELMHKQFVEQKCVQTIRTFSVFFFFFFFFLNEHAFQLEPSTDDKRICHQNLLKLI